MHADLISRRNIELELRQGGNEGGKIIAARACPSLRGLRSRESCKGRSWGIASEGAKERQGGGFRLRHGIGPERAGDGWLGSSGDPRCLCCAPLRQSFVYRTASLVVFLKPLSRA